MIEKLFIKNYLIIKEAEIFFQPGFNVITGETGAGKSIILDALGLLLGERADYSLIKKDNDRMVIEGEFRFDILNEKNNPILKLLEDIDPANHTDFLIIRRELLKKGISRSFINDTPVNISVLKELGDLIIDIHSQNEHQSLLKKEVHIDILDRFLNKPELISSYQEKFSDLKKKIKEFSELSEKKRSLIEKRSFIEYQLKEINNLNPVLNEDSELETELNRLENSEEIASSLNISTGILYDSDQNIQAQLALVIKEIKKIVKYDPEFNKTIAEIENSKVILKDISSGLIQYSSGLNYEPERIEFIRSRLSSLNSLKKKYGTDLASLIKKAGELSADIELIEYFDFEIDELKKKIQLSKDQAIKSALEISNSRKKAAKELEKEINLTLKEVSLESAEFKVNFAFTSISEGLLSGSNTKDKFTLTQKGIDDIEFFIRVNKGGDLSPLRKAASGGEISRVMLAIKSALSNRDNIPILVFDEIDTGISGKIAGKTGKVLQKIAKTHQIISITHLPQIAALGDNHLYVSKKDVKKVNGKASDKYKDEETIAEIKTLTLDEKVIEIAKMLSGEKITDSSISSAKELINMK
ncbi:DNA repair protein RecN [soil metagenome]